MLLEATFGLSLVLKVSFDTAMPASVDPGVWTRMSVPQKDAVLLPLVQRATECILREVADDPRARHAMRADEVSTLIVDSFASCRRAVR